MLKKITLVLQAVLNISLLLVYLFTFVLSIMGVLDNKFAFLLEIEGKESVMNLSIPMMLFFGMWLSFYMFYYIWIIVMSRWNEKNNDCMNKKVLYHVMKQENFYIKSVAFSVNTLTAVCWILFLGFQIYIFKNGHIPALDVLYRDYDKESLCWSGYRTEFIDFNKISLNCIDMENAMIYQSTIQKTCVLCRIAIRPNEPTVLNQNYPSIIMGVLMVLAVQCWNFYVQVKETCCNIYHQKKQGIQMTAYKNDDDDNDDESINDEEKQSELRCFEQIAEAKSVLNFLSEPSSSPSSPLSSFATSELSQPLSLFTTTTSFNFNNETPDQDCIYKMPKPVTCTCSCYVCSCAESIPKCLKYNIKEDENMPLKKIPTSSFLSHKSSQYSTLLGKLVPIPTPPIVPKLPTPPISFKMSPKFPTPPMLPKFVTVPQMSLLVDELKSKSKCKD